MSSGSLHDRSWSHHRFTYLIALACLLILIFGLALAPARLALAAAPHEAESPEAFLARAYSQRAQAMTLGDPTLLDGLYDPASTALLKFEKDRIAYFQDGFWASVGGKVLAYDSAIRIEEVATAGSVFKARLNEWLTIAHVPGAKELPFWTEEVRRQGPREYAPGAGRGPHGEYIAGMGTPHEVSIVKGSGGWRISSDFYREPERGEAALSPGTVIGSWAAPEWTGGPIDGHVYPKILPLTGSAETPFPFAAVTGVLLLGLGLVVRGLGGQRRPFTANHLREREGAVPRQIESVSDRLTGAIGTVAPVALLLAVGRETWCRTRSGSAADQVEKETAS